MIDATDHLGVPVITSCPTYVNRDGRTYEIAPDALVRRRSDLVMDFAEQLGLRFDSWQRNSFASSMGAQVIDPHRHVSVTTA